MQKFSRFVINNRNHLKIFQEDSTMFDDDYQIEVELFLEINIFVNVIILFVQYKITLKYYK